MKFSRQEYWSGLPFASPRDLPNPGIEPGFPALQAESLLSEPPGKPQGKDESKPKKQKNGEDYMISLRDLKWHEVIHFSNKVPEGKKRLDF